MYGHTKSAVCSFALRLGVAEPAASAAASATGDVSATVAAQVVWTPIDVVSQNILLVDGVCGLYRGLGVSVLTYAPSSAVWWASYATAHRLLWRTVDPAHPTARY